MLLELIEVQWRTEKAMADEIWMMLDIDNS
jgi:hypothetical protein